MSTSRLYFCRVLALLFVILFAAGFFYLQPSPGKWKKLAELVDSSGNRLVVAQTHYDLVEGWGVTFFVNTSDQMFYSSTLEIETPPWKNVRLEEKEGSVKVWRSEELVGMLTWGNRMFTNFLKGSSDSYTESKRAPEHLYFD